MQTHPLLQSAWQGKDPGLLTCGPRALGPSSILPQGSDPALCARPGLLHQQCSGLRLPAGCPPPCQAPHSRCCFSPFLNAHLPLGFSLTPSSSTGNSKQREGSTALRSTATAEGLCATCPHPWSSTCPLHPCSGDPKALFPTAALAACPSLGFAALGGGFSSWGLLPRYCIPCCARHFPSYKCVQRERKVHLTGKESKGNHRQQCGSMRACVCTNIF